MSTPFAFVGCVIFIGIRMNENGVFAPKNVETYEHNGMTWLLSNDNIPLTVEDLTGVEYGGYVKERTGDESLLLGQYTMRQYPRMDDEAGVGLPRLEYRLVLVKAPWLQNMCLQRLLEEGQEFDMDYVVVDPAAWGADSAWRLEYADGLSPWDYLLCYGNVLVELKLDSRPTAAQMYTVGEHLGA